MSARIGSLAEFQATGRAVAELSDLAHMNAQGLEGPGRVYCGDDGFFIQGTAESGYCLTIENDSSMGALPALEAKLYRWAESQGYLS